MHGPEVLIPMLGIIGLFGSIITYIYMKYKSKHLQRMALIDNDKSAEIFSEKPLSKKNDALKLGMLLTGTGCGWFLGLITEKIFQLPDASGVIPCLMIGGGLGLIGFYTILKNKEEEY